MAMMYPAHDADNGRKPANTRPWMNGALSLRSKWLTLSALVLATGLAGCAREPAHRELSLAHREVRTARIAAPLRAPSHPRIKIEARQNAELRVHKPDPALLVSQPAPNCEFKRTDVKSVDPDEWARLKTEYERQCYQDAEKAARDRLGKLQASSICEVERAPQKRSAR